MDKELFKGSAVFIFGENEISVEFTGDKSPFERVKPTLDTVIKEGQLKIHNAVEEVIAKHDKELQEIAMRAKAERYSALANIGRTGGCLGYDHSMRMAALSGSHDRYLDQLLMAQNRSMGVNYGLAAKGIGFWGGPL